MAQVKIELPEEISFSTIIPIRITDINYGGHVGNDTVLTLFHEARMQFLTHYEASEMNFGGAGLIMRNVVIEFKKEIFYGYTVKVYVGVSNFSKVSFDVFYKMVKSNDETIVALGQTGMVCYNYQSKKIVSVPEEMLKKFR
jgi:acyl-CoA thioester hydrolase